jgi:hypothetical protein
MPVYHPDSVSPHPTRQEKNNSVLRSLPKFPGGCYDNILYYLYFKELVNVVSVCVEKYLAPSQEILGHSLPFTCCSTACCTLNLIL